ncbi:MAG: immunoglobulin domain-containing protein [Bacteroidetes bacterium]|nr:immunoglobulin domain-containing protein [Bacteroidota bacterium]
MSDSGSDILPCDNDAFYLLMGNCNFGCSGYVLKFDKFLNSSVIVNLGYPGGSSYNGFTGAARMSGKTNSHLLVAGYYAYGENTEMLLLKCDTNGLTNASPTFLLQSTPASGIPCDGDSVLLVAPPGFDKYEWCINQNRVFKNMNVNNDSLYVKFKGHYYCSAWQGNAISYSNAYYFSPRPQVQNLSLTSIDNRYEFCGKSMDSIRLTTNVVSSQCQWLKNDSILSGAVSSTLVVKESGYYALRVLSPWNTCDTGKTKSVYINANYVPEPVIKDSNIAVAAGFCQAIGHLLVQKNNSYSYDWAIDEIPHSNSSNLFSSPVKPGLYTCRITNTCGAKRSKPYTLYTGIQNVRVGNSIQYFGQVTGCGVGSSVLLYAPTGSSGPFQWKRNNVLLANQTAPVLNVTQNGEYRLRYYNPTCMQMLDTYPLNIKLNTTAPVLSTPSGTMSCGSGLPLAVSPVGIGITYEWFRNDISLGMTNGNPGIIALKSGKYRCKVSNPSCGTQFTNEVEIFTGFVQPVIESYSKEVCEGDSTLLKCAPYGINAQYKWYKNGVQLAGATAFNLYVKDSGNYFCEINNSCGTLVSNPVYVGKIPIPSLISVVTPGLTACKKNPPTITTNYIPGGIYKWTDSTGDELLPVLPNKFQAGSTGIYSLEVKRGLCTVKMNPVNITVLNGSVNYLYTSAYPQICNGEVLKLSAYPWQGNTYQWYKII